MLITAEFVTGVTQSRPCGAQLRGKRDASFLRAAFRLLRDDYGIRPCLSTDQFLEEVRNMADKPEAPATCTITFLSTSKPDVS